MTTLSFGKVLARAVFASLLWSGVAMAVCGDGVIDVGDGETCDDGNTNNFDGCSDVCAVEATHTCTGEPSVCTPTCGNGTIEPAGTPPETCDDGNTNNFDGCSDACATEATHTCTGEPSVCTPTCGNGTLEPAGTPPETCDDGNTTNFDGCSDVCAEETGWNCVPNPGTPPPASVCTPICGDGIVISPEDCDTSGVDTAACDGGDCTFAGCGDGYVNAAAGEDCDDAGESATCDSDCTFASCGDDYTNTAAGETCDGTDPGSLGCSAQGSGLSNECYIPSAPFPCTCCGDGVVQSGEGCDTGGVDTATCDGAFDCTFASCGDGYVNAAAGEECDDSGESATCDSDCTFASCGDDYTNTAAGETCDGTDAGINGCSAAGSGLADECRADCGCCGDFAQQPGAGEACDLGPLNSDTDPDACRTDCTLASCGDDVADPANNETCDGTDPGIATGCAPEGSAGANACRDETAVAPCTCCADGVTDTGESCDDGNTTSGDGCDATCAPEAGFSCIGTPSVCTTTCGDGIVAGPEQCDPVPNLPDDCCSAVCAFEAALTACARDGNRCTFDQCDASGTCTHPPKPDTTTTCGSSTDTDCDNPDTCLGGVCQDNHEPAGTVCRPVAPLSDCDVAEVCDGTGAPCPLDGFASPAVVCRPAAGQCDAPENCTGTSPLCPPDFPKPPSPPSSCVSGGPGGACDAPDFCVLFNCPDAVLPPGVCRPAVGGPLGCDVPESCNGFTPECPPDLFQVGTPCLSAGGPPGGLCDLPDICPGGTATCPDSVQPATFPCHPSLGVCDPAEFCDGTDRACPPNMKSPPSTVCRPAADVCDLPENCDGSTAPCPLPDAKVPASPPTECRASAGDCDPAEACDGINNACPADALSGPAILCGPVECRDTCTGTDPVCPTVVCARFNVSEKGSILYFSALEVGFSPALTTAGPGFALSSDTFITLVNDLNREVCVQWYFINGDDPLPAIPGIERAHPGWNSYDCMTCYTPHENVFMSLARGGGSLGCQPLTGLDPGFPPGRPDPDGLLGDRIVRGYAIAFAVDIDGNPISWNHLSGHVTVVNYRDRSAWEYNTYALQCVADPVAGNPCGTDPTTLSMDGQEYGLAWDKLLFDFYAVDATAFSRTVPAAAVTLDTDLTLYPVSVDLRPNSTNTSGPVLTRADIVIWNENEDDRTGTSRCLDCWDQTLLSNYDAPNNFMRDLLGTDKGYARIDGVRADSCDGPGLCCCRQQCSITTADCENSSDCPPFGAGAIPQTCGLFNCFDPDCDEVDFRRGNPDRDCSENAALLGVADKILTFLGAVPRRTDAGTNLVAVGLQRAVIRRDLIPPTAPVKEEKRAPRRGER